jgi:uncharacterized protein YciI
VSRPLPGAAGRLTSQCGDRPGGSRTGRRPAGGRSGQILPFCACRFVGSAQYVRGMAAHYAVTLVHGPGWDASRQIRDQDAWDEHAAFMDGLVDDGFIILGGPLGNGGRSLHVVEAAGEREIEARLSQDPWAAMGLLQIGAVEPWALWLDSRGRTRAR